MTTSPLSLSALRNLAALLALSCASAAHAVDFSVGAGVGYAPKYEGAKKYEFSPFPVLSISGENWFIGGKGNGPAAGLQYAITPEWRTGVFVGLHGGRKEKTAIACSAPTKSRIMAWAACSPNTNWAVSA